MGKISPIFYRVTQRLIMRLTTDPGGTPGPEQGQDETHGMQDDICVTSALTGELRRQGKHCDGKGDPKPAWKEMEKVIQAERTVCAKIWRCVGGT